MRVVPTLCVAIVLSATLSAAPALAGPALDRIRDSGILVGATDPAWPPYSWREPIGEYAGFDVDVTREIASRLGARAEFVTPPWEEQVAGQWGDGWDVAVTEMTPTADRAARLAFPAVYAYGFAALAVRTDDPLATVEEASGRKIAVLEDTIFDMYLRHQDMGVQGSPPVTWRIENPEIIAYAVTGPNYLALSEGRVDALIDDRVAIEGQIARGRAIRIVGEPLFSAPAAVAIAQGDPELAAELARIVGEMRADGTLRDLSMRWFGFDASVPPALVTARK
ncbi:transporter substrate-binding domain-containing protein [Amaricoccus sp.]|uniref:transporter substrate-binding domain-containing protein n=1 Tax=Amaricoccus sp. TaxID=1872485 RepID=UPI001B6689E8|nr:transporter substrate-binding domain-containing protein [Amaricoccus sp.]MBP7001091.1 transporter substrate-binding domain-containing protein [Amaricoccus sp.]